MKNNTVGYLTVMAFLFAISSANALSNSLTDLVSSSRGKQVADVTLQSHELFARADVGGQGGIFEFLKNTTEQRPGICNIDKARLPQNQAFIFNEISVGYSTGAINKAGGVGYGTALPAALRNAEFEIKQGRRSLFKLPMASLANPYDGTSEADNWTALGALKYLADNESFTWVIHFPDGESITAGTAGNSDYPYLEVRLRGYLTDKRSI